MTGLIESRDFVVVRELRSSLLLHSHFTEEEIVFRKKKWLASAWRVSSWLNKD